MAPSAGAGQWPPFHRQTCKTAHLFAIESRKVEGAVDVNVKSQSAYRVDSDRSQVGSVLRARLKPDGKDEHLLPQEYHGNPVYDAGSLVTIDRGYDIADFFKTHSGMNIVIMQINNIDLVIRAEFIEVVVSREPT